MLAQKIIFHQYVTGHLESEWGPMQWFHFGRLKVSCWFTPFIFITDVQKVGARDCSTSWQNIPLYPENTNIRGNITVRLTSCLFCLDSAALLLLNWHQSALLVWSNPNQSNRWSAVQWDTYCDVSTYKRMSLHTHRATSCLYLMNRPLCGLVITFWALEAHTKCIEQKVGNHLDERFGYKLGP